MAGKGKQAKSKKAARRAAALDELLSSVSRFSEDLSASSSVESLLRRLSRIVGKTFPGAQYCLALYRGEAAEIVATSNELRKLKGKSFSAYSKFRPRGRSRMRGTHRLIEDFESIKPFAPLSKGARAILTIQLIAMSNEVGLLWIELPRAKQATPERISLMRILGNQFASAYRSLVLTERTDVLQGYVEGLFEHSNAAILVLDKDRRVQFVNPLMLELLGQETSDVVGTDFFDFVVVDERYGRWKSVFESAAAGEELAGEPMDFLSSEGDVRHLVVNATQVPGRQGKEKDILFVGLDVTEAVGMRNTLAQQQKLASLGEMTAGIAHEFNSPLTVLSSAADLLLRGAERVGLPTEDLKSSSIFVRESLDRVNHLARNLLSFSKPEMTQSKRPLDLNEEIERALSFSRYELQRGGVKVVTDLAESLPPVTAVPGEIQQVLINLLTNARQAMGPSKGNISVRTRADGTAVEIDIADEGPGINRNVAKKIFEPFITTKQEGSGLGLYITRSIIERNGGAITFDSTRKGTTFHVRLPASGG